MYGIYCHLNLHVTASDIDVIRAVRRKLRSSVLRDKDKRDNRHAIYRAILPEHRDAQRLYVDVVSGNLG